jgi:putative membrane protein
VSTEDSLGAGAGPSAADPAAWRRLSTRMLLLYPVQELPRALPALFGLLVAGSSRGDGGRWGLLGIGFVVALGIVRWFTTTYRITPEHVQVRRGLLRRQVLTVPRDRLRTVDVTAHPLHRLLGLARVIIGTGRSDRDGDGGIKLDGLTAVDASRLREELLHRGVPATAAIAGSAAAAPANEAATAPANEAAAGWASATAAATADAQGEEVELARLDPAWVRYGPFTLSGVLTLGLLAGALSQFVSEGHLDPGRLGASHSAIDQIASVPLWLAIVEVVIAVTILVAAASTVGYVLAFWRFQLTRHSGGTLRVTRGLVTIRATTIEERRLRGVEISEPLLLRAVRGARCIAIATGLRVGRGAERGGTLLLPPAPRSEATRVAALVLGRDEPLTVALRAHGAAARRRRYTRALPLCALSVAGFAALWRWAGLPAWAWLASLALLPAGALLAIDRYRGLGHAVAGGHLVCSTGSLVRRRNLLAREGIIGWNLRQSFFQRRAGLVTLTATTAAGRQSYRVQDVETAEALRVAEAALPGLLSPFLAGQTGAPAGATQGARKAASRQAR